MARARVEERRAEWAGQEQGAAACSASHRQLPQEPPPPPPSRLPGGPSGSSTATHREIIHIGGKIQSPPPLSRVLPFLSVCMFCLLLEARTGYPILFTLLITGVNVASHQFAANDVDTGRKLTRRS
jgi:hypothetical protein